MWLDVLEKAGKAAGALASLWGLGKIIAAIRTWRAKKPQREPVSLRLEEHKVTYFPVRPGDQMQPIRSIDGAPAPVGSWVHFTGRVINSGSRRASIQKIKVALFPLANADGEKLFPAAGSEMPFGVPGDDGLPIEFRYHLNQDAGGTGKMAASSECFIDLEDQDGQQHPFRFMAHFQEHPHFLVHRRRH